jgi:hypothetical protein
VSEIEGLLAELKRLGVPTSTYGLGHDKAEAFCLVPEGQEWAVFYSERGDRVKLALHQTFTDASTDLLSRLLESRSVKRMMSEEHWRFGPDGRLFLAQPNAAVSEEHERE